MSYSETGGSLQFEAMMRTRFLLLVLLLALPSLAMERCIDARGCHTCSPIPRLQSPATSPVDANSPCSSTPTTGRTLRQRCRRVSEFSEDRDISGWVLDRGIVCASTPNGDQVLYGEAVDCRKLRHPSAQDARARPIRQAPLLSTLRISPPLRWPAKPFTAPPISSGNWRRTTSQVASPPRREIRATACPSMKS